MKKREATSEALKYSTVEAHKGSSFWPAHFDNAHQVMPQLYFCLKAFLSGLMGYAFSLEPSFKLNRSKSQSSGEQRGAQSLRQVAPWPTSILIFVQSAQMQKIMPTLPRDLRLNGVSVGRF